MLYRVSVLPQMFKLRLSFCSPFRRPVPSESQVVKIKYSDSIGLEELYLQAPPEFSLRLQQLLCHNPAQIGSRHLS